MINKIYRVYVTDDYYLPEIDTYICSIYNDELIMGRVTALFPNFNIDFSSKPFYEVTERRNSYD